MRSLANFEDNISALLVMDRIAPQPADQNELKVINETKLEILIKNRKIRQAWLMTRKINCAIDRELSLGRLLKSVVEDRNLQTMFFQFPFDNRERTWMEAQLYKLKESDVRSKLLFMCSFYKNKGAGSNLACSF